MWRSRAGAATAAALLPLLLLALPPAPAAAADGCAGAFGWGMAGEPSDWEPYCTWSGFVSIPYIPLANTQLVDALLPTSCNDPKLTPELKANCQRCCTRKTRDGCLAAVAQTWNDGADVQSCNWMSYTPAREKVREVAYSLGINYP